MKRTGSPTPKRNPQRPVESRTVPRSVVLSGAPVATASPSFFRRSSAAPRPPNGASESYDPPPRSASKGSWSCIASARAVTVCVTVPSPPAMATTRGRSRATCAAASRSSRSVRVSSSTAPGAALRNACEASGQLRFRCAFGFAMMARPATPRAYRRPALPARGPRPRSAVARRRSGWDARARMFLIPPEPRLKLVLVHPQIPPNTSNVARLCAVTGTPLHLVAPLGFALTEKRLRRAGLDYWHKVHAATHARLGDLVREGGLNSDNVHLFTGRGTRSLWDVRFHPGDWLVLGEEQHGLPDDVLERFAERWVRVPMIRDPSARSLNLSTCAGVVLYEALRQCQQTR